MWFHQLGKPQKAPAALGAKAKNPAFAKPTMDVIQTVVNGAANWHAAGDPLVGDGPMHATPMQGYSADDTRLKVPAAIVPPFGTCQHLSVAEYMNLIQRGTVNLGECALGASVMRNSEMPGIVAFMIVSFLALGFLNPYNLFVEANPVGMPAVGNLQQACAYIGADGANDDERIRSPKRITVFLCALTMYSLGRPSSIFENEANVLWVRRALGYADNWGWNCWQKVRITGS